MNENSEGTPNPLNPLGPNPSQPDSVASAPEPVSGVSNPIDPMIRRPETSPKPVDPIMKQAPNAAPLTSETTPPAPEAAPPAFDTLDPMARPMEKAAEPTSTPPKKKKTGLIIGAIICGLIALGCIIAAVVVALTMGREDPVARAIEKIASGDMPTNTSIDGTVKIDINDADSEVQNVKIAVNSQLVNRSMINSSTATLTASLRDGGSFSMNASEIYAANGDLYLKIDGLANILSMGSSETLIDDVYDMDNVDYPENKEDAIEYDATDDLNEFQETAAAFSGVIDKVDGNWVRFSTEILSLINSTDGEEDNGIICATNLLSDTTNNSNALSEIYNKYPFILSTNENIPIASLKDPIYKVSIDEKNFANFMREAQETEIFKSFMSCMGYGGLSTDVDDMTEDLAKLPDIYVEVDKNYDFTRVYFVIDSDDDQTMTFDFNLSYPDNVNVSEPVEYKDFTELIQEMTPGTYDEQGMVIEDTISY